ncbi:hypothetical protein [Janthinobacterium fluminis]|uniref:Uncharacterized protein n=1 Tax=Janthinobacterium fluminis TaxID=2987524 RepID=A0ABT5K565_9BURK|nr:hypothetical protein [Janthinobacterium fluminis]MDC8760069.1 hypothetical protein [Janthinobacterium fluminis]
MPRHIAWCVFFLLAILTSVAAARLWMLPSYQLILSALAVASFGLGAALLNMHRFSWRAVLLVVSGLALGQWWLLETLLMLVVWSVGDFAP